MKTSVFSITGLAGTLCILCGTLYAADASAASYKSVGNDPAVMYNAPSERGRKVFIAPRGMPVEVILDQDGWTKVRDATGDLSWMQTKALAAKRNVVVTAVNATIHAAPADTAAVVATVEKNVLLEWQAAAAVGWVKVRHQDGTSGYVKASEVWGE